MDWSRVLTYQSLYACKAELLMLQIKYSCISWHRYYFFEPTNTIIIVSCLYGLIDGYSATVSTLTYLSQSICLPTPSMTLVSILWMKCLNVNTMTDGVKIIRWIIFFLWCNNSFPCRNSTNIFYQLSGVEKRVIIWSPTKCMPLTLPDTKMFKIELKTSVVIGNVINKQLSLPFMTSMMP